MRISKTATADLLRKQLEQAGLSQRGAAKELGIDERTMRRYCSGELDVPMIVTMALRWIAIVHNNESVIEFTGDRGARLKYVAADGKDIDITGQEMQRLANINKMLRAEAKKVVRADRIARRKVSP
jgi:hypothetical protein